MKHAPEIGAENLYQKTATGFWQFWHAICYRIFVVPIFRNEYDNALFSCRFIVQVFSYGTFQRRFLVHVSWILSHVVDMVTNIIINTSDQKQIGR